MTDRPLGRVLVTGGSSGLGAAVVAAVAEAGGRPVVLDRVAPRQDVEHELVDLVTRGRPRRRSGRPPRGSAASTQS